MNHRRRGLDLDRIVLRSYLQGVILGRFAKEPKVIGMIEDRHVKGGVPAVYCASGHWLPKTQASKPSGREYTRATEGTSPTF
jgi:hypothetical protein